MNDHIFWLCSILYISVLYEEYKQAKVTYSLKQSCYIDKLIKITIFFEVIIKLIKIRRLKGPISLGLFLPDLRK